MIKKYINLLLQERIRNEPLHGVKSKFDLDTLKSIVGNKEIDVRKAYEYVNKHLQNIGEGSSRSAFTLTSKRVLKVALPSGVGKFSGGKSSQGLGQNRAELEIFLNSITKPIIARIYDYDLSMKWLISEIVRPVGDFEMLCSIGLDCDYAEYKMLYRKFSFSPLGLFSSIMEVMVDERGKMPEKINDMIMSDKFQSFYKAFQELMNKHDLILGDLIVPSHWGKTADGRIVLYDYGATNKVWDLYYRNY